jgi:hypothetical protein
VIGDLVQQNHVTFRNMSLVTCILSSYLLEMAMPCWPDLWNTILGLRWFAWPALILAVIVLLIWAPAVKWRWLRVVLRILGGSAALCILAVIAFAVALNAGDPKPEYRTVSSPNGLHEATLFYQAGFLGRDLSSVEVTKKGCCQHFTAYEYDGPSDLDSTTMVWLDDSHLQIGYRLDPYRYQRCETRVADIIVTCTSLSPGKN